MRDEVDANEGQLTTRRRPALPEHPELRAIAEALEGAGLSGELLDADWRTVYESTELCSIAGLSIEQGESLYGKSLLRRNVEDAAYFGVDDESGVLWWRLNAPIMRTTLAPGDEMFDEVFNVLAEAAARVQPHPKPPRAWSTTLRFQDVVMLRGVGWLGRVTFFDMMIHDASGGFIGVLRLARPDIPEGMVVHLARGDRPTFERMLAVADPARRPAAILFADLEASGELSRRVSSRAYFELVRKLVDVIDSQVIAERGIVGKHAGDGASALFLVEHTDSESAAAAAAVRAGRSIRDAAAKLGPDDIPVRINVGIHWGATLTVGQVATRGRLEVTALGDEMNEAARIEHAAIEGTVLASKPLLERLDARDAAALDIDLDELSYRTIAELEGSTIKDIRDAGGIAVTGI
ncbi:MAG: adenylate/guanylate cyclase domain-containing protein [Microthrixaceae bacterium]